MPELQTLRFKCCNIYFTLLDSALLLFLAAKMEMASESFKRGFVK